MDAAHELAARIRRAADGTGTGEIADMAWWLWPKGPRPEGRLAFWHALADEVERAGRKACPHCGKVKPLSEFNRRASGSDAPTSWCRECANESARQHRAEPARAERRGRSHRELVAAGEARTMEVKAWNTSSNSASR